MYSPIASCPCTGLGFTACESDSSKPAGGIDVSLMDKTIRPQDDFYNFVNGSWMKTPKFQTIKPAGEALTN